MVNALQLVVLAKPIGHNEKNVIGKQDSILNSKRGRVSGVAVAVSVSERLENRIARGGG